MICLDKISRAKFLFVVKLGSYLVYIKLGSDELTVFVLHIPAPTGSP